MPQRTGKVVFKKILADQFLGAPFFAVTFFLGAGLLEGHTLAESWKEFKQKFPAVYAVSYIKKLFYGKHSTIGTYYIMMVKNIKRWRWYAPQG